MLEQRPPQRNKSFLFCSTSNISLVQYWVSVQLAVYGAALVFASPIWGHVADHTASRRNPLLFGLFVLAAATALVAIGTSLTLLIIGRVLQGFSCAITWVTGLALLVDTVGPADIGQFMGYVGAGLSMALLLSPLLGGIVFGLSGYESVFGMCWGLLGADVLLRLAVVEKKAALQWLGPEKEKRVKRESHVEKEEDKAIEDAVAAGTTIAANLVQRQGEVKEGAYPEENSSHPGRSAATDPTTTSLEPLPALQGKQQQPTLLLLLSSPRLLASLYGALIQAAIISAFDSTLPLRVRGVFGWTSLGAGLIFLPITGTQPLLTLLHCRCRRWSYGS